MLAANSGLGWLSIKFFFLIFSLFYIRLKKVPYIIAEEIEVFDQDLNSVWENAKQHSLFIAVRNSKYLKTLYSDKRFIKLKFSDTLLIMVPKDKVDKLRDSLNFVVLEELNIHLNYHRYWWLSILVIPCVMLLSSFNIVPIHIAAILGCVVILALRTITVQDAFESINLSVIFLIAALIPLGIAINFTGFDKLIAGAFLQLGDFIPEGESQPYIFLAIFYFITFTLTAFLSNAVVAIILTPLTFVIAPEIGCDPRPFLMAICFGASACFMTPMGYQTNMMVFGPGQYRLKDFFQMGIPLTVIFWIVAVYCIPKFWQF